MATRTVVVECDPEGLPVDAGTEALLGEMAALSEETLLGLAAGDAARVLEVAHMIGSRLVELDH